MSASPSFFSELRRRNVVRMAGLFPRFQTRLKLPAIGEKHAADG